MPNVPLDSKPKNPKVTPKNPLSFDVQPQLLQDLGVNLYTKLDQVLVEFLANSHDADATVAEVVVDFEAISKRRATIKAKHDLECSEHKEKCAGMSSEELAVVEKPKPVESESLGEDIIIRISDDGSGMDEADLKNKFLIVSRRRREAEGKTRTVKDRLIMGRKGLGKLAGFGVGHKISVYSKTAASAVAYRITLDYDDFETKKSTSDLAVPLDVIEEWNDLFPKGQGTIIELSKLVYSSFQRETTVDKHVARNFRAIKDFAIFINGIKLTYEAAPFAFEYPNPTTFPGQLIEAEIALPDEMTCKIRYRIGFYGEKKYLGAGEYGVRIYCHNRLASQPDLFELKSSSDGYIYHTYMEGVVEADYIDDQKIDYIATDRQGLRWQNGLLQPLYVFIQKAITAALSDYAKAKETKDDDDITKDVFTKDAISQQRLHGKSRDRAFKIAKIIAKGDPDGITGDFYKKSLPVMMNALGNGEILAAISQLSKELHPQMAEVVGEIVELTRVEYDGFVNIARGRLDGIKTLQKIIGAYDFKLAKNEKEIQALFEKCPWLIDPTFYQFITADASQGQVREELARHLEVGQFIPASYVADDEELLANRTNKRPDLVFLLGNTSLARIVIVELKAPNTPLLNKHLSQLKRYIDDTKKWLKATGRTGYSVKGILIGCRDKGVSKAQEVRDLEIAEEERPDTADWSVRDLSEVLEISQTVHRQFLDKAGETEEAKAVASGPEESQVSDT